MRAAARAEVEREQQPGRLGRLLHFLQRHAGIDGDGPVDGVDRLHAVHAFERDDDIVGTGYRTADEPGDATVRHDGLPAQVAELENG